MKNFIVHDKKGKILRTGLCQDIDFKHQAHTGELIMEGEANDVTQKVVDGKIVNKIPRELTADNPPEIPQPALAVVTKAQWQDVLNRLDKLE